MRDDTVFILLVFLGIPYILGWIYKAHQSHLRFMKVLQLKSEMNQRLLERASSDPAIFELLKSEAQHQLFDVPMPEMQAPAPYMKMVAALQASFLLLGAGGACLWYGTHVDPAIRQYYSGEAFRFFGALGFALGIGSLLSAAATFVVARKWKALNNPA